MTEPTWTSDERALANLLGEAAALSQKEKRAVSKALRADGWSRQNAAQVRNAALEKAIKPLALLGVARIETDIALLDYNVPFYDCDEDVVLYHDHMGNSITVGDVRSAKEALRQQDDALTDGKQIQTNKGTDHG